MKSGNGCSQSSRFPTAGQEERRPWERDCVLSYFPMFSPMIFLLAKKNGNHVLFGFVLSSEQSEVNNNSFNFAHSIFLAFVAAQEIRDGSQAISYR